MKKKIVLLFTAALSLGIVKAQSEDPVLMKINNRPISKSEFEYLYNKNNTSSHQTVDEYLQLFTDYKLKVEEARNYGLDTMKVFTTEFGNYKKQLTEPYLKDTASEEAIARMIYDRLGENIEVSHILVRMPNKPYLMPSDTLEVYEKALSIREELLKKNNDENFEAVARKYSQDQNVDMAQRPGYLGRATSMMFVAPFEEGMYATPINEISMPVRSMYGYHLIKVHDRLPDPGKINVSHIMFAFSQRNPTDAEIDSLKRVANEVYAQLQAGGEYSELCLQYSSDYGTADKGGNMGWIQAGARLPKSFTDAAYSLKNAGDISEPITTDFGYHIIKLEEKQPRDSWEDSRKRIISQIKNTDLNDKINKLKIERFAQEIPYELNSAVYEDLLALAGENYPTDSVSLQKTRTDERTLLKVGNSNFTVADFTAYFEKNGSYQYNVSTDFLDKSLNSYILSSLTDEYASTLEDKYPEYKNLLREYHDGILLFNIMNQEVWENAANDTLALTNHFRKNRDKYKWDSPRYKGSVIYAKDDETLKEAKKIAAKNKKATNIDFIVRNTLNNDSINMVTSRKGIWAKGENQYVDYSVFKTKTEPEPLTNYPVYFVQGKILKNPEDYTDVKGLVISDYQEIREKEWMQSLRDKYTVEIDEKILGTIK